LQTHSTHPSSQQSATNVITLPPGRPQTALCIPEVGEASGTTRHRILTDRTESYALEFGNQNFFSSPNSTVLNTDQINQRVSLIDQLLAVNSNATAAELLQRSRASLVALLPK